MRLRQIEVFHAIYTSDSMTNAAAKLNVSQPSVSKVLAHAEQQLGYRLFDRIKGKLIPTPEAHQLFKHVADVYQDVERLRHVATNLKAASAGRIRVAATPAFGLEVLPKAVASFRQLQKDAVFELETLHFEEITDALLESRIDVGLAFDPESNPAIKEQQLATGCFVVLAPDAATFDGRSTLSVDDLKAHPFIGLDSRGPLGRSLSSYISSSNVDLNIVTWAETYHVAKALVACGAGVTIADEITARSAVADDVVMLALEPALEFDIRALHLSDAPLSIVAKKFTEHLGAVINDFLSTPN